MLPRQINDNRGQSDGAVVMFLVIVVLGVIVTGAWGCPHYNVWQARLSGVAQLAEAEGNRQIKVQEALAVKESSKLLADAEVERARGVASANEIIGGSLKGNEAYLRYLWITNLDGGNSQTIYVPTEAGLPILEATRHLQEPLPKTGGE